jgi:hypothetical protein
MAGRHVARLAGWAAAWALIVGFCAVLGRPWRAIGAIAAISATAGLLLWLPRAAHAAFAAGR